MTTYKHTLIAYLLATLLCACGGGGSGITTSDNQSSGQYDLAEYLFDQALDITSASTSYQVSLYDKTTGSLFIQYTDTFEKTFDDTVYWTSEGEPASTYVISSTMIEETVHSADNAIRPSQRFVDIGTTYMDASEELPPVGMQNAKCTVSNHHTSIDLSTLTGVHLLANGIYHDVLEVNCITGYVINNTVAEHTNLVHYFARDIGLIFSHGTLILFGDIYIIPEL